MGDLQQVVSQKGFAGFIVAGKVLSKDALEVGGG